MSVAAPRDPMCEGRGEHGSSVAFRQGPGRWVLERAWPSTWITPCRLFLAPGRLTAHAPDDHQVLEITSPQTAGLAPGAWCPHGLEPDQPGDQREEAGGSLLFDSAPLEEAMEILGAPVAQLQILADRPVALAAVTLSEVFPDGAATRISFGLLNLTHRGGHARPEPLTPGRACDARIRLNEIAHRFGRGNRLRLAFSSSYWPVVWPAPETVTLRIAPAGSSLELPLRPRDPEDDALPDFPPAEGAAPSAQTFLGPRRHRWTTSKSVETGTVIHKRQLDEGTRRLEDTDWTVAVRSSERFSVLPGDPLSARVETLWERRYARGDWQVRLESKVAMTAGKDSFRIDATLDAFEGRKRVYARNWEDVIPRDLV